MSKESNAKPQASKQRQQQRFLAEQKKIASLATWQIMNFMDVNTKQAIPKLMDNLLADSLHVMSTTQLKYDREAHIKLIRHVTELKAFMYAAYDANYVAWRKLTGKS